MLHSLVLPSLALLSGFIALIWGAERFVVGAANTAFNLGVSSLIIGLTIVGMGTSAPEMIVSAMSSFQGKPGIAVGNAVGSNIANIGLILGVTALIAPIPVKSGIIARELPLLMLVTIVGVILLWDRQLTGLDGILLLAGLGLVMGWLIRSARRNPAEVAAEEFDFKMTYHMSTGKALLLVIFGLLVLLVSSRILVWGAVEIAQYFGVSDLVIGLTIIAIGTSLPELAASIAAALKKHHDLVLGNIIGSNIFNLLGVLGISGLITSAPLDPAILSRDLPVMILLTLALFTGAYGFSKPGGSISRIEGGLFLAGFSAYLIYLAFTSH